MPAKINIKEMLEAGVHFGHQSRKWNPKMRPYIYTQRDGIHIIDLAQTSVQAENAYKFVVEIIALGNSVLFVGTKKQASNVIMTEATRSKQHYVCNRWLGGMLTNFKTIKGSIDKLETLSAKKDSGEIEKFTKKEALQIERQIAKLDNNLGGIRTMSKVPGVLFIVDPNEEKIALQEANKLGIPVIALADTNANPDGIDHIIVGNDDAIRSIEYFTKMIADACEEGLKRRESIIREQKEIQEKEAPVKKGPQLVTERKFGGKGRAYVAREDVKRPAPKRTIKKTTKTAVETKAPAKNADKKVEKEKK